MKITCKTLFDITATGITGSFRSSRLPFVDSAGQSIASESDWAKARNQQRNWETVMQLISLRAQIFEIVPPWLDNSVWTFEFQVEIDNLYQLDDDPVGILKQDCDGVPMLRNLTETQDPGPVLLTNQPGANIWFSINN